MAWLRRQADVTVEWFPYDLHPEYPPEGISRAELIARYGDHFADAVRAMAIEAGLPFSPHPERVPRTRAALELTEWARAQGPDAHESIHEALMDAYWAESQDISDWEVLERCVDRVGLAADAARSAVTAGRYAEPVDAWTRWAQERGISAIPAFVFDERLLVSGAVPHEHLAHALERARQLTAEEGSPAPPPS